MGTCEISKVFLSIKVAIIN